MIARFSSTLNHLNRVCLAMLFALITGVVHSVPLDQQTHAYLKQIRAIRAAGDAKTIEGYNKAMDEAWKFFSTNRKSVLPILRKELRAEMQKNKPNNLVLLDIGHFVRLQPGSIDKKLGKEALLKLDTDSKIVRWNQQQLFDFAYAVVADQDTRILPFLDKTFLKTKLTAFVPQHALSLDETLVCVFLYGKYGHESASHLARQLRNPEMTRKIIEVLIWLGTPDNVQEIKQAMLVSQNYETFIRGVAFMMRVGGPLGRKALLTLNLKDLDDKSREYYGKVHKKIEWTTYETLRQRFKRSPDSPQLSDEELKKHLSAMYANYGKDNDTQPGAIFESGLPTDYLIRELIKIRGRMFYRLSDEALDDVAMTNAILNTLYYKQQ